MKRVLIIATGGTIACKKTEQGLMPMLSSEELLALVPQIRDIAEVDTLQLFSLDSTNMQPAHWIHMMEAIRDHYDQYDGFVICHGTDTMAYSAAALSYLCQNLRKPVIVTGSQKPIEEENTDARVNLEDSVRYASSDDAFGVCMVFDGRVIDGTRARKMRTKSYNAFDSINYPQLAVIQDGQIIQYIRELKPFGSPRFYDMLDEKIFVFKLIPGMDPSVLLKLKDSFDGFIIESYGVGGIPWIGEYSFDEVLNQLDEEGKILLMATQVIHEGSDMTVYQVGRVAKEQYKLMETYDMTLEAAVTKLMWAMGQSKDKKRVRELFYSTVGHDLLFHH